MPFFKSAKDSQAQETLDALSRSLGIIEFAPDGTILTANDNFLTLMGYSLAELVGKPHSMLCDSAYVTSPDYRQFWTGLAAGNFQRAQFHRIAKGGRDVWIEATYNPVRDKAGRVYKVVKIAADVTQSKLEAATWQAEIAAISRSQGVISFAMDGTILDANDNFLRVIGYSLAEIKGHHHSMLVDPAQASRGSYKEFWAKLNSGEFVADRFQRMAKGNKPIWIEASYNPILDMKGKPFKVIKFATDITGQMHLLDDLKSLIDLNFGEIDVAIDSTRDQSREAEFAAANTVDNVQAVAAAAEELAASIHEIAGSMAKSRNAADSAFDQSAQADQATHRLTGAASAMGGIVDLIQSIASQINMLALNATIESARAGDAGKGFAVVAGEVKHLAKQVADATTQISREIDGIQSVAGDVVGALNQIRDSVETVREYVAATAAAVEEQSAVTRDMSSNMQAAAASVHGINGNVGQITMAVSQVASAAAKTRQAAEVLAR